MPVTEGVLLVGAVLVLIGAGLSKVANRLGVPSLLLFLVIGMVAGSVRDHRRRTRPPRRHARSGDRRRIALSD
jgi:Kef-type K+ transport system membrane component KefB